MDRDMLPRVAIWTSAFEAQMEGVSVEVALLRRRFPRSVSWGLSHRHWAMMSAKRGYCLHPNLHWLFRSATRILEPLFDINHIFGSLGDWFYLEGHRRRPTVLTSAVTGHPVDKMLLDRVDCFVAEHPEGHHEFRSVGIHNDRIRTVLPPVDLQRFRPQTAPVEPFEVLFASSPEKPSWLNARGLPAILDAAAERPKMHFRLLWRPWGNSVTAIRQEIESRELQNVELVEGRISDMASQYRRSHVTVAPFTDLERCKPMPNCLIESLACGRPVICSPLVGLSPLLRKRAAGIVCQPEGAALADALDRVSSNWLARSLDARELAEKMFSQETFVDAYQNIYADVIKRHRIRNGN